MIRRNRQYRLPDELPVFKKEMDDLPIFAPEKKKDFPLLYERQKTGSIPSILPSRRQLKSQEEKSEVFTQVKNFKKSDEFAPELTDEEATQEALSSFQRGDHSISPDSPDPVGELTKQIEVKKYSYPVYKVAREKSKILNDAFFQSGQEAREYLQKDVMGQSIDAMPIEKVKEMAGTNATKQLAAKKYESLRNVETALNNSRNLEEAAVRYKAAMGDENIQYLLDKSGGLLGGFTDETSAVPLNVRGAAKLQFLMNPDLHDLARKNPELKQQIQQEIANFPVNNPEYATRLLADAIANRREQKGENNWFANIVGKESTDKIVDELIEEGSLPGNYRFLYEREIRPKLGTFRSIGRGIGNTIGFGQIVNDALIETPGLIESAGKGWENTYRGAAETIANLPRVVGLPGVQDAMQSDGQEQFLALRKEYDRPQFEPKGLLHKTSAHGGQMAGFMAGLLGGTSALKATNLITNPAAANATMMVLATHADNAQRAKIFFPKNDFKQFVYTGSMDVLNAAMGKFLPGQQIPKLLKGGEEKVGSILSKMVDGEITTSAAKSQILNWFGETAKGTLKGAEFMGAISAADDLLTQTLQQKGIDFSQSLEAGWEGFKVGLMATGPLAAFEGALKSNPGLRNEIINIATHPEYYKELANREAENDPEFAKIKEDVIGNIDHVSKVWKEVEGKSDKEKKSYVLNSLSEKIKLSKAETATDPTIKKKLQKEAKDLGEIKEGILNGVPEEKVRLNQVTKEVKAMYDSDYLTKGAKEMLESKKSEEGEPKFDDSKVKSFLETVSADTSKKYPSRIKELAEELFPDAKETKSSISVSMPGEIKVKPEDIHTVAPKEYVPDQKAKVSIILPKPKELKVEETIAEPKVEEGVPEKEMPEEPIPLETETPVAEPTTPIEVKPAAKEAEGEDKIRLSHSDTEKIYKEFGLPERLETPNKKDAELEAAADRLVESGYDFDAEAAKVMSGEKKSFTDEEQVAFAKVVGALIKKQEGLDINSPEFNALQDKIEAYSRASDVVGTLEGRSFRSRKLFQPKEESLSDYVMREKEAAGVETLTEKQKENVQKEFNDISAAEKAYQDKINSLTEENNRLKAEAEIKKVAKSKQGQKKDYAKEREEIFASIKEKLKKSRGELSSLGPLKDLAVIAPDVAKLVKSYVEQGVTELAEVIKKVHSDLKDDIAGITEKDVRDLIAGVYNEPKPERNKLAEQLFNLRTEAKLLNKLETLETGGDTRSENKKRKDNQAIAEIKAKIKPYTDLQARKTKIKNDIAKIEEQLRTGNFTETKKEPLKLDKEAQDLHDWLIKLKQQREERLIKEEYARSSFWNKAQNEAANALNAPRTLMASVDYSAPLRQALFATTSHPIMASRAFGEMFKASWSEKYYDRWFENLKKSDNYQLMHDSKLAITDVDHPHLSAKEEAYMSNLPHKVPILGKLVKGSERAYSMYLNKMRVDIFNRYAAEMQRQGITFENSKEQYQQMAAFVNNITGRGDLGKTLNESGPLLSALFFSPRLLASRLNTLTYMAQPRFWNKIPRQARVDYFKGLLTTAGIGLGILALAKASGAETEDDPRSPDFGKIKSGNTRWDIWGGHQQYIRLAAQMITNQRKSSTSGKITEMGTGNPYSGSRGQLALGFLRGKLAPVPSVGLDLLIGENAIGEEITSDWQSESGKVGVKENLMTHLLPLVWTGMAEALKDQGPKAWFTVTVPSVLGVGVSTYEPKPPKSNSQKPSKQSKAD